MPFVTQRTGSPVGSSVSGVTDNQPRTVVRASGAIDQHQEDAGKPGA